MSTTNDTRPEPLPQRIMSRALIVDAVERRARLIEDAFDVLVLLNTLAAERAKVAELVVALTGLLPDLESGYIANPSVKAQRNCSSHIKRISTALEKASK